MQAWASHRNGIESPQGLGQCSGKFSGKNGSVFGSQHGTIFGYGGTFNGLVVMLMIANLTMECLIKLLMGDENNHPPFSSSSHLGGA